MDPSADTGAEDKGAQGRHRAYGLTEGRPGRRADEHWRLASEAVATSEARRTPFEQDTPARLMDPRR